MTLTQATKEYAKDLEKMERRVIDAEMALKELAKDRLSVVCPFSYLLLLLGQERRLPSWPPRSTSTVSVCLIAMPMSRPVIARDTHARWETPRERYDECNSKFSLSKKPRLSN